jgi:hypothetical protein
LKNAAIFEQLTFGRFATAAPCRLALCTRSRLYGQFASPLFLTSANHFTAFGSFHTHCYKITNMPQNPNSVFSRRERQIMDIIYRLGRATAKRSDR